METFTAGQTINISLSSTDTITFSGSGDITFTPLSGTKWSVHFEGPQTFGPVGQNVSASIITATNGSYQVNSASVPVMASTNLTGVVEVSAGAVSLNQKTKAFSQKYQMPVIERFNAFADWTATNSGGAAASKAAGVIGGNCINLSVPAGAGQSTYVTQDQTIDLSAENGIWVLLRNRYRTIATGVGLTTYLANGANMTVGSGGRFTCVSIPYAGAVSVQPHWIPKSAFGTLDGTPTFASPILSWRFRLDSVAGQARDIDLCGVVIGKQKPTVIVSFDDGWDTSYTVGHVQARKREIPLTHYLIGSLLDRTDINYITTAQAIEMAAQGDYIGLHGASPWDADLTLPVSDKAALVAKLGTTISKFEHASYPEGRIGDQELWQQMETTLVNLGFKTARLAGVTGEPTLLGYGDPMALTSYPLNNTMSLAQAQAAVDTAISSGGTVIFYGHKIAGTADALTWVTSDYTTLLDYIVTKRNAGQIEVKTIKQWYDQTYEI